MASQAQIEGGSWADGRPTATGSPTSARNPNPAKAADGKRMRQLAIDEPAAAVVRRIFDELLNRSGMKTIAENLTRDEIACPSAHDPVRNHHRCGIAWSGSAVRVILADPRYTGRQVWNRQRTDEVLIDVRDVALGHTQRMQWNYRDQWVWSEQVAHPPIIDEATFRMAAEVLAARSASTPRAPAALLRARLRAARDAVLRCLRLARP
jgi:site-specific DNA recombinase